MEKMSAQNLVILGLLLDNPMSAYEMAQILETQIIGMLVKISSPTVYKNIKNLYKEGYLSGEVVKEGEMPEKKIYTVTEEGKVYFIKLMEYYSKHFQRPMHEFDAFLVNIDKLDKETGLKQLDNLREHLYEARNWVIQHEQVAQARNIFFAGRAIIKQYRMMFTALTEWIEEVIEEYRQEEKPGKYSIEFHEGKHMPPE